VAVPPLLDLDAGLQLGKDEIQFTARPALIITDFSILAQIQIDGVLQERAIIDFPEIIQKTVIADVNLLGAADFPVPVEGVRRNQIDDIGALQKGQIGINRVPGEARLGGQFGHVQARSGPLEQQQQQIPELVDLPEIGNQTDILFKVGFDDVVEQRRLVAGFLRQRHLGETAPGEVFIVELSLLLEADGVLLPFLGGEGLGKGPGLAPEDQEFLEIQRMEFKDALAARQAFWEQILQIVTAGAGEEEFDPRRGGGAVAGVVVEILDGLDDVGHGLDLIKEEIGLFAGGNAVGPEIGPDVVEILLFEDPLVDGVLDVDERLVAAGDFVVNHPQGRRLADAAHSRDDDDLRRVNALPKGLEKFSLELHDGYLRYYRNIVNC